MKLHKDVLLSCEEAKLKRIGQDHLFERWDELTKSQKDHLLMQIEQLDERVFHQESSPRPLSPQPLQEFFSSGSQDDQERGKRLIAEGKCACLVLAGGMATRLRFKGPKGCFPVSIGKNKTLFQLLAEKVKAASKAAKRPLQLAIMTSPLNHVETETYFVQNGFFGLEPPQVHFFFQEMWPLLDFQKRLFLQAPDQIGFGPNGNGGALRRLYRSGLWQSWKEQSIERVSLISIDNPLADPFDAELFGFHARREDEVTLKAVSRSEPKEKVGVVVRMEDKIAVVDYMELSPEVREAHVDGALKYSVANIGLFCFCMDFIEKVAEKTLPIHGVKKSVKMMDKDLPKEPNVWKFEEFIFDLLPFSEKSSVLIYPRNKTFAPLKNIEGEDSIKTVQAALQAADREVYQRISGVTPPPESQFELAQEFYYPTEEFTARWKGKSLPDKTYVEAL
ncbi:MAG: putative uridylyltransferase [Chlamydiae bacterium]|nr:putative uridylyltransferase [Chlamydiota bacterium]